MSELTEEQLDRHRMAALLRVDESDLGDEKREGFAYWYEGAPEFCRREYQDKDGVWTALGHSIFGEPEIPHGNRLLTTFSVSPETECPWCGPGTGHEHERENCKLCEGDGLIYEGEGWVELVLQAEEEAG